MQRIVLAGECLSQVRIAFPIGIQVAVGEPRIAAGFSSIVPCNAAVGQRIAKGVPDGLCGDGRASKIALACWIAPGSLRVPMPRFDVEFRILAIGDRLPAR